MDDAERGVTILHRRRDDAQRDEVIDLLEIDLLGLELQPDAVEALDAAVDADHRHLRVVQLRGDVGGELLDHPLRRQALGLDAGVERLECGRLEITERQLLELVLDAAHPEPIGDRRVDVERLLRDAHALVVGHVLQRAHVVQAVGKLDEDDSDVVDHRQQHLAEVLRLPLFGRRERDGADLRDAFDDVRDVFAEELADLLRRGQRVFDDVVQQPGRDAHRVEFHVRENVGNFERMNEIWLAGMADLSLVLQGREHVGLAEQFEVGVRAVATDFVEQVLETDHLRLSLIVYRINAQNPVIGV